MTERAHKKGQAPNPRKISVIFDRSLNFFQVFVVLKDMDSLREYVNFSMSEEDFEMVGGQSGKKNHKFSRLFELVVFSDFIYLMIFRWLATSG